MSSVTVSVEYETSSGHDGYLEVSGDEPPESLISAVFKLLPAGADLRQMNVQ